MKDININYDGLNFEEKITLKIRKSFIERYKLAKQFKDTFYTKYFAKQIRDIDKELEESDEKISKIAR